MSFLFVFSLFFKISVNIQIKVHQEQVWQEEVIQVEGIEVQRHKGLKKHVILEENSPWII